MLQVVDHVHVQCVLYMHVHVHVYKPEIPCTCTCIHVYMNNHVYRTPFSDIERKKEVAKSKERRKEIDNFINYSVHVHVLYKNLNGLEK